MTVYAWIIIGLSAATVMSFFGGMGIGYVIGRSDGYAEQRADRAEEQLTERRSARAGRHARTAPARDREGTDMAPPGPFPPVPATRPPWYLPAPVTWASPGTSIPGRPQPSGTSPRPVTGPLPRVRLTDDATTGEIRAIGAAMVAAIEEGRI